MSGLSSGLSLGLVLLLFKVSDITAYEIVYFKCAATTLVMFCYLLYNGVYILALESNLRSSVILRGFLYFGGIVFFLLGVEDLESISTALIIQQCAMCIA